jgi:hypothetical protein
MVQNNICTYTIMNYHEYFMIFENFSWFKWHFDRSINPCISIYNKQRFDAHTNINVAC